ncbi:alpha/beta hydrolase [Gordoniibacillus kamchatkensis]|uniref:alpha/beta hydrolase n=1 Tax=Gordoniibacillus kamchatkensis TaxID=1590651 RepID=UPI001E2ECE27|nr:alpha/beta fold hydrolase [Paenibacillus sp. VKM B-2647]
MDAPVPQTPQTPLATAAIGSASTTAGTLRRRRGRWLLTALISLAMLGVSLILAFHAYIAWTLARPHIDPLQSNPQAAIGVPYENVTFPSRGGGSTLQGWYLPAAGSTNTVIFSHGYGGNREEIWVPIYSLAKMLHDAGYNVLMFDYGYVQGGDRIVTGGIRESQELLGAFDYMKDKGAHNLFIWGFSMGAGTALQAALQENGTAISGMILDSTFLLNPDTLYHNMRQVVDLPRYPSLPLIRWFSRCSTASNCGKFRTRKWNRPPTGCRSFLSTASRTNALRTRRSSVCTRIRKARTASSCGSCRTPRTSCCTARNRSNTSSVRCSFCGRIRSNGAASRARVNRQWRV